MKRRRRRVRWCRIGICVLVIVAMVLLIRGCGKKEKEEEHEPISVSVEVPDISNLSDPFNTMSADWGADDLVGWHHYDIPDSYARTGGYLPDIVQVYTYCLCRQYGLDYEMVLALIEYESGYKYDAVNSKGAYGYMQIVYVWHSDEVNYEKELLNPYTNIRIGLLYLKELNEQFDTMEEVLTAYNYGCVGARKLWEDKEHTSSFAINVMRIRDGIKENMEEKDEKNSYRPGDVQLQ